MKKIYTILCVAGVLACVALAFLPCLKSGFFNWDDGEYVVNNPVIRHFSLTGLSAAFSTFFVGNYQPLTILSYSLDYRLFGLDPAGYHLTNLILHLANVLLVLLLFRRLTGNLFVACATALLFGLHPLKAEAVSWLSCRKELLYSAFCLAALMTYHGYLKNERARGYLLTFLFFLCALLCKGTAVIFPLVMFLFDYLAGRKLDRKAVFDKIPFFLASLAMGLVTVLGQAAAGAVRPEGVHLLEKAGVASSSVFFYLSKLLVPAMLSCAYPRFGTAPALMAAAAVAMAVFVWLIVFTSRFTNKIFFGFFFFLLWLVPVLQIVPFGSVMVADRYTYLPSAGIAFIAASGFAWLRSGRYLLTGCLIVLAALSWDRCLAWKDSVTLWSREIKDRPSNPTAYFGRGSAYLGLKEYEKAYVDLKTCLYLSPAYTETYLKLAKLYAALNRKEDAVRALERYLTAFPADAEARSWLEAIDSRGKKDVQ